MKTCASPLWTVFLLRGNRMCMTETKNSKNKGPEAQSREERLKAALKANISRRKAQAKARSEADSDPEEQE